MTNEEFLRSFNKRFHGLVMTNGWNTLGEIERFICNALDEARKDEAIAFVKGISGFIECKAGWLKKFENPDEKEKFYTIEQLYELFKLNENE